MKMDEGYIDGFQISQRFNMQHVVLSATQQILVNFLFTNAHCFIKLASFFLSLFFSRKFVHTNMLLSNSRVTSDSFSLCFHSFLYYYIDLYCCDLYTLIWWPILVSTCSFGIRRLWHFHFLNQISSVAYLAGF